MLVPPLKIEKYFNLSNSLKMSLLIEKLLTLTPPHWVQQNNCVYDKVSEKYGIVCADCKEPAWISTECHRRQAAEDKYTFRCYRCNDKRVKPCQIYVDKFDITSNKPRVMCGKPAVWQTACGQYVVCEEHKFGCRSSNRRSHEKCYSKCLIDKRRARV